MTCDFRKALPGATEIPMVVCNDLGVFLVSCTRIQHSALGDEIDVTSDDEARWGGDYSVDGREIEGYAPSQLFAIRFRITLCGRDAWWTAMGNDVDDATLERFDDQFPQSTGVPRDPTSEVRGGEAPTR